ncbi:hypothetical protein N0V88_000921 [Collariella sp. IMI 366227]|nr:hypothetical protein N0V88_000921 [Collariella sp. IMI 366227]
MRHERVRTRSFSTTPFQYCAEFLSIGFLAQFVATFIKPASATTPSPPQLCVFSAPVSACIALRSPRLAEVHEVHSTTQNPSTPPDATEKLELSGIPQSDTRGSNDVNAAYYRSPTARSLYLNDRPPPLPLPHFHQAYSTADSSPRVSSASSISSSHLGSQSSFTSAASSIGPKTPGSQSPTLPILHAEPRSAYQHYPAMTMNGGNPDMYYSSHMSAGPAPPPQTVTSSYPHPHQHPHQHQHQQPPLLQPGQGQYPPPGYSSGYGYPGALTPPAGPPVSNPMGGGPPVLPLPNVNQGGMPPPASYQPGFDTTGQIAPPGMKPRVTATLWEDEGSLCFQVEARGICVARREDNAMINGTKLLNVAGMTRGRRDGILKSEKVRHVVKIGPMHLKGVWIPYERALDFANKEKITELLYPLFVHNISSLLCHPTNQNRTNQAMAAHVQRNRDALRPGQQQQGLPSLQHHHQLALPGPPHTTLPSQPPMGRPPIRSDFPTPPSSATMNMGPSDNFQWNQQPMTNGQPTGPISIDTALGNGARSLPNTPATTPPGSSLQSMQSYPPVSQPYDSSRQMYQASPQQPSPYPPANSAVQDRPLYSHATYVKSEMGPPSARGSVPNGEHVEAKPANGILHNGQNDAGPASGAEEEQDHEHDGEYTHDSGAYDNSRSAYNYSAPPVATLSNEHSHLASDMSGSPHQGGSGRATPRTAAAPQSYYAPQGYNSPRVGQTSSNLYNVMSNDRGSTNGTSNGEVYGSQGEMPSSLTNGYAPQAPLLNGSSSLKRGRDDDDERAPELKRHRTLDSSSMPSPTYSNGGMAQPVASMASQRRR